MPRIAAPVAAPSPPAGEGKMTFQRILMGEESLRKAPPLRIGNRALSRRGRGHINKRRIADDRKLQRVWPLLRPLEIAQVRRRLVLLRRHQLAVGAQIVVFLADADVSV